MLSDKKRAALIQMCHDAGVMVLLDSKFGRSEYTSVQSSWPALEKLATAVAEAAVKDEREGKEFMAGVELTDGECWSLVQRFGFNERRATSRHADVRKGFCLSGAFLHYEVQPYELARFARAVIAAHIAKQGGAA